MKGSDVHDVKITKCVCVRSQRKDRAQRGAWKMTGSQIFARLTRPNSVNECFIIAFIEFDFVGKLCQMLQ